MMKWLNNLIERIGADKLLHFLLFAWIVSEAKQFGDTLMWLAYWVMAMLSIAKEIVWDEKGDFKDVLFGIAGGVASIIIYYLS